jgi:hypothetical protein
MGHQRLLSGASTIGNLDRSDATVAMTVPPDRRVVPLAIRPIDDSPAAVVAAAAVLTGVVMLFVALTEEAKS